MLRPGMLHFYAPELAGDGDGAKFCSKTTRFVAMGNEYDYHMARMYLSSALRGGQKPPFEIFWYTNR